LIDYQDILRQHDLDFWPKDHEKAVFIRKLAYRENKSFQTYRAYVEEKSAETAANTVICVIRQTCYLLDMLKNQLGDRLLEESGINERIYRERKERRTH